MVSCSTPTLSCPISWAAKHGIEWHTIIIYNSIVKEYTHNPP